MTYAVQLACVIAFSIVASDRMSAQSSFWRQLDEPFGGDIWGLVGGSDGSVLASAPFRGIHRSTDDGITWRPFGPGGAVRPIFCSVAGSLFGVDNNTGLHLRTAGSDATWRTIPIAGAITPAPMIATDERALLFAGLYGIDRSTDDGLTWKRVGPAATAFRFPARGHGTLVYAVSDSGIFRSSDDGRTWIRAGNVPDRPTLSLVALADGSLIAGSYFGIFRSRDSGGTFAKIALDGVNGREAGLAALGARTVLAATRGGLYRVESDGATTPITVVPYRGLLAVHVTGAGSVLVGYEGRGIYRSTDSALSFAAVGFSHGWDVVHLDEGPDGTLYAGASGSALSPEATALFRSTDRGNTWSDLGIYDGLNYQLVSTRDSTLVGLRFRSTNNGRDWQPIAPGAGHRIVATRDGAIVGATPTGIVRSTDDGDSWTTVATTEHLYDIARAPNGELWAIGTQLHSSTDDGVTWSARPITAPRYPSGGYRSVESPADGVLVLLAHNSLPTVARSTDGGASWDTTGFRCGSGSISIHDYKERGIYIVSDCGVAMSRDAGRTWTNLAPKPRGERYGMPLAHTSGDIYFAGWTGIHVGRAASGIKTSHTAQRLPNVVARVDGGSLTIEGALSLPSNARVEVTTLLGETLTVLHSGPLDAGNHRFTLDGLPPPGTYIVSLITEAGRATTVVQVGR